MTTADPILSLRDLRVEIPTPRGVVKAVDGVTLDVPRGGALGLVGESGCGKSMTLRAILGILPGRATIAGGEVVFDGEALSARSLGTLRGDHIGMVFQEPMTALNPVMRVGEQIAEGPRVRLGRSGREARERALELLRLVGIPDPERRYRAYPHELSGGLRQRIVIAIALACEPKLLLCDEPTTALDVTIQDQILHLLARLRAETGVSQVLVTHDLAVVAQTCERVAVMYAARIVETGTVDGGVRRAAASVHARAAALGARLRRAPRAPRVDRGHAARSRLAALGLPLPPALRHRARRLRDHRPAAHPASKATARPRAAITRS